MQHSHQDALDTAARRSSAARPQWHPILAAVEASPGLWYMVDAAGACYGVIRFLTISGQQGYRAVTWARRSEDRELVGYFTSLRSAAAAAHRRFLTERGPAGG